MSLIRASRSWFDPSTSSGRTTNGLLFIVSLLFSLAACRPAARPPVTANSAPATFSQQTWDLARDSSVLADASCDKQAKARLAQEGISYAENCTMKNPEEAACYYYHAINTGIYYSAHVVGYQKGMRSMVKNLEKTISLNDKLDHGGAYRTLGKIYLEVPETTFTKNGVTRDVERAISYLQKAIKVDPEYPENLIYLAQAFLEIGQDQQAREELGKVETIVPQWKNHRDYASWIKLNKELSGKLKK